MRAWPVARSMIFDAPYVREANERTTSWITEKGATQPDKTTVQGSGAGVIMVKIAIAMTTF